MLKRFGKYCIVSIINGLAYYGIFYLFTTVIGLWYMYSAIIASVILVAFGFTVNSLWVWKKNIKKNTMTIYRFVKYCVAGGTSTVIGLTALYLTVELAHIPYTTSFIAASGIVIIGTFLVNNYWTWSKTEGRELDFIIRFLEKTKLILVLKKIGVEC